MEQTVFIPFTREMQKHGLAFLHILLSVFTWQICNVCTTVQLMSPHRQSGPLSRYWEDCSCPPFTVESISGSFVSGMSFCSVDMIGQDWGLCCMQMAKISSFHYMVIKRVILAEEYH